MRVALVEQDGSIRGWVSDVTAVTMPDYADLLKPLKLYSYDALYAVVGAIACDHRDAARRMLRRLGCNAEQARVIERELWEMANFQRTDTIIAAWEEKRARDCRRREMKYNPADYAEPMKKRSRVMAE